MNTVIIVFRSKRKTECKLGEKAMKSARKAQDKLQKACERASETCERTLHTPVGRKKKQNVHGKHQSHKAVIDSSQHTSTITCIAAPRVWHFSAFHFPQHLF